MFGHSEYNTIQYNTIYNL